MVKPGPYHSIVVRQVGAVGRVSIPSTFRERLGLETGASISWELDAPNQRIIIRPSTIADVVTELAAQPYSSERLQALFKRVREGELGPADFMDELRKMRVDYVL